MSEIKKYVKQEAQLCMLGLEHPTPSDFYLSAWQLNRSPVLLLILRVFLFLGSVGIALASMILYTQRDWIRHWFIYLTHWGLLSVICATGFASAVSARSYFYGPISAEFCLPWYVKTYWVIYNVANPMAYLITIFYWSVLYSDDIQEEANMGLNIAVHGLNSVVMLILLFTSTHPSRVLHVYQPCIFAFTYVIFGIIYHFAGGVNTEGENYIYPVIDWAKPGPTIGWVVLTALLLIVLHLVTVGLAAARDAIANRCLKPSVAVNRDEAVALRQHNNQS